ncbi:MAG TPA: hypothetical protein VFS62_18295, partial [Chloroflexota bacterium]|nr:hypothetical protein [Chloroflexota bacterium]
AALQARKCANILVSGAPVVLTGNPGCLLQMRAGLPASVQVRHIVDVLAEAYCHPEERSDEGPGPSARRQGASLRSG